MKMEEIDRLRGEANQAILIRRDAQESGFTGGKPWDDVEWLEEKILKALREWWAQGCRDDIEAGCPCGKVAVLPGEDPLVMWCAAGHPTDGEGKIKIP
jgi:hypothetical protein